MGDSRILYVGKKERKEDVKYTFVEYTVCVSVKE